MSNEKTNDEFNDNLATKREQNNKRKWKFITVCFFLIIAIGIGLYVGYRKLNSNPVSIYKDTINNAYSYVSKYLKENKKNEFNIDYNNDSFVLGIDATLKSDIKELKNFSGKTYNLELGLDSKDKLATLNADIKENNEEIISLLGLIKNNTAYLKSSKLLNKVLNLGEYNIFDLNLENYYNANFEYTYDYENIDYILKTLKNNYLASLDKSKFKITDEKITIDEKVFDSKKIVYLLDKENAERTTKYMLNSMIKDKKMLEAISNITNKSKDSIKKSLEDALNDLDFSDYETIEMVINTDKFNNFLAGVLSNNKGNILKITYVDKKFNFKISDSANDLIYETKDEYSVLKYLYNNKAMAELKFNNGTDDLNIDYDINVEDLSINGNIIITDIINTKSKVGCNYKINFNTSLDTINLALEGKFYLEKKKLDIFDTTNNVKLEDLSEEELTKMYVTLMDIVDIFGISDLIDGMDNM